jgi:transcriptional regulator with AAA-type ATPase domain
VTWNKDAFRRLVVPAETRELIEASVTVHGRHLTTARDVVAGKGRGLLILLHGGPGTGKTLTAESIAEAQERPLYRVTCGDIGLEPDEAEKAGHLCSSNTCPQRLEIVNVVNGSSIFNLS